MNPASSPHFKPSLTHQLVDDLLGHVPTAVILSAVLALGANSYVGVVPSQFWLVTIAGFTLEVGSVLPALAIWTALGGAILIIQQVARYRQEIHPDGDSDARMLAFLLLGIPFGIILSLINPKAAVAALVVTGFVQWVGSLATDLLIRRREPQFGRYFLAFVV